ncbi:hypothetical protein TSTA_111290 [Talaromyces stipitatus ATCC 10500]|uniref:Uncharacterized protein n=1 Tax=Talaromyces stipitatus (strain ATCC 10500 / CBS 375.48 / QM 6759 / NRRL 1006) TaxID=441959 RepID=B8M8Z0_TALSN|nr:uncharacterized protein TSTA_111290 [Talaromyces stipitatus ATCC 10500]EED17285.1 hypothetical protein TSTA_111290 [Talaromyces stipitatus ATCC 10500]
METLQPSSPGAVASERLENPVRRAEPSHQGTQTFMDSPPSTLSLDESLLCNTENAAESIIVLDDDDEQAQATTSRPRRANRRQLDYSYPDYEHLMNAVAARNPSRKRKRQKDSDALSLESILDQFSQDVRDQGQAWISEIKDLRFALKIVYEQKEDLKEKLRRLEDKLHASE